jgi:two-component system sensor histidine kinase DegS
MALEQARNVAIQLKPPRIHELGLGATIRDLADTAGVPVEIRFDPDILPPGLLEPDQEIGAYRVVQEAIGNAARHSHAAHIWIDAEVSDRLVRIEVGDDGVGFDQSARSRGMGLAGMQERSDILLGRLDIESRLAMGTTVTLAIPRETRLTPSDGVLAGVAAEATR